MIHYLRTIVIQRRFAHVRNLSIWNAILRLQKWFEWLLSLIKIIILIHTRSMFSQRWLLLLLLGSWSRRLNHLSFYRRHICIVKHVTVAFFFYYFETAFYVILIMFISNSRYYACVLAQLITRYAPKWTHTLFSRAFIIYLAHTTLYWIRYHFLTLFCIQYLLSFTIPSLLSRWFLSFETFLSTFAFSIQLYFGIFNKFLCRIFNFF